MIDGLIVNKVLIDGGIDNLLKEVLSDLVVADTWVVLAGDEDSMDSDGDELGSLVSILDGDLGLGVWSDPGNDFLNSALVDSLAESLGEQVGEGHELGGLIGGVSDHESLVSGSDILLLLLDVDGVSDLLRLLVNSDDDGGVLVVESLGDIIISDLLDGLSGDLLDLEVSLGGDFSENHAESVLDGSLAGDLGFGVLGQASIQDGVGDIVAQLIRMTVSDGLGGEKIVLFWQFWVVDHR